MLLFVVDTESGLQITSLDVFSGSAIILFSRILVFSFSAGVMYFGSSTTFSNYEKKSSIFDYT